MDLGYFPNIWPLFPLKIFQKMRMSEKCRHDNKNSDNRDYQSSCCRVKGLINPLTSRRTDGGKNGQAIACSSFCSFVVNNNDLV